MLILIYHSLSFRGESKRRRRSRSPLKDKDKEKEKEKEKGKELTEKIEEPTDDNDPSKKLVPY